MAKGHTLGPMVDVTKENGSPARNMARGHSDLLTGPSSGGAGLRVFLYVSSGLLMLSLWIENYRMITCTVPNVAS